MKKARSSKEGASILIALVLMIVFLTIGASVLTAASASVESAATLRENRQMYYFARSVASTFTDSLTNTKYAVLADTVPQLIAAQPERSTFTCTLSSDGGMPDAFLTETSGGDSLLNMEPVQLTLKNVAMAGGEVTKIGKMTAEFSVRYQGQTYQLFADYRYQKPEGADETGWTLLQYYQ